MKEKMGPLRMKQFFVLLFFPLLLFGIFQESLAAEKEFPKKEITVIVGFAPGGGRDILVRGVTKTMTKYLGVPMVVTNLPGAAGARGATEVYTSPPDGYTLGAAAATEIIGQMVEKQKYDMSKSTNIGRAQSSPAFLLVKADSPFKSVKDFKTFGKTVRKSTFSLTSSYTMAAIILAKREGFPISVIGGYENIPASILSLIRGEVEFTISQLAPAQSFVESGQIKPILTIAEKRAPEFPNVPAVGEIGYADLATMALDFWIVGPPGIPKERVKTLEEALLKTLIDPEFVEWAKGAKVDPGPLNSEETTKMVSTLFKIMEQYKDDVEKVIKK